MHMALNENKIFAFQSSNKSEVVAVLDIGFSYIVGSNNSKTQKIKLELFGK